MRHVKEQGTRHKRGLPLFREDASGRVQTDYLITCGHKPVERVRSQDGQTERRLQNNLDLDFSFQGLKWNIL